MKYSNPTSISEVVYDCFLSVCIMRCCNAKYRTLMAYFLHLPMFFDDKLLKQKTLDLSLLQMLLFNFIA